MAFSGIEEFIDTPVKRYSTGMNARLGFSIAAHLDPDVLIIDEVLSVGDFAFQERAFGRLQTLAKSGMPVVVVTHQLERLPELCTQAILLQQGRVARQGTPQDCIEAYVQGQAEPMLAGGSVIRLESVVREDEEDVPSGGHTRLRIHGSVDGPIPVFLEPVAVCARPPARGRWFSSTSNSRLGVALPDHGSFTLEVHLQLNVPSGRYLCETVAWDNIQQRDTAVGPVVRINVIEGRSFWGSVQMNPAMTVVELNPGQGPIPLACRPPLSRNDGEEERDAGASLLMRRPDELVGAEEDR